MSRNQHCCLFVGHMRKQSGISFHSPFVHNFETVAFDEWFGSNLYPNKYYPTRICNTYTNTSKQGNFCLWGGRGSEWETVFEILIAILCL